MNNSDIEKLYTIIETVADPSDSFPVETSPEWEAWVARPCVEHQLAPRHACAALEVIGFFADYGLGVGNILRRMVASNAEIIKELS